MASLAIPAPPLEEQRRIADFLDDRVARIDQILAARSSQRSLVRSSTAVEVDRAMSAMPTTIRASRVTNVLPGYAFPSADFSSDAEDIPLLRGVNVGVGELKWDDVAYWPVERLSEVERFRLEAEDVVVGMDRPWIGGGLRIATVSTDSRPLLLQRVAKFEPSDAVRADFLFWAFQSPSFRETVESELTGLSVPHLSGDQILSFHLPFGSMDDQADVVDLLNGARVAAELVVRKLDEMIERLQEYKQSLITAAVTGELDVTTASGRSDHLS